MKLIPFLAFSLLYHPLHCFPVRCLFHLIDREHQAKHICVHGSDAFKDHPLLFSKFARSPLTITVDNDVHRMSKTRPAVYLPFIPFRNETDLIVDKTLDVLRQLTSNPAAWFPSARFILVIVKSDCNSTHSNFDLVAKLISVLWKHKVFNNLILVSHDTGEEGEVWSASPFAKGNECGKKIHADLSDCVIRVSTRESPPFAFKISEGVYAGADVEFVRLFSEVSRARVEWQERPSPESGLAKSVVLAYYRQIIDGFVDLAIGGGIIRAEFDTLVEYLQPHSEHMLTIYVPDGDIISGWSSIYCMFSFELWSMVFLTTFIAGFILYALEFLRRRFSKGKIHFTDGEIFFVVLAILLEQSCWKTPHFALSHRLFLGTLCLGLLLTSSLYKIFLQSYTVRPPVAPHVRTFDDLVDFNLTVVASDVNMNVLKQWNFSSLSRIKSWTSTSRDSLTTLQDLEENRNFAFLERDGFIKFLTSKLRLRIHSLEDKKVGSLSVSFVMPKGSEFKEEVDVLLHRAIESGLYVNWMSHSVGEGLALEYDDEQEPRILRLVDFWAVFCLLIIGHSLAFLVHLGDLLVDRVTTKRRRQVLERQAENRGFKWLN